MKVLAGEQGGGARETGIEAPPCFLPTGYPVPPERAGHICALIDLMIREPDLC